MEGVRIKHPKLSRLSQNQCIKYYKERSNTFALRFISDSCFCFISVPFGVNLLLTGALKIIQQNKVNSPIKTCHCGIPQELTEALC